MKMCVIAAAPGIATSTPHCSATEACGLRTQPTERQVRVERKNPLVWFWSDTYGFPPGIYYGGGWFMVLFFDMLFT